MRVPGWGRRLWQGSTDHRGTPQWPGLVCTLVPLEGEQCWGLAYAVEEALWPEIQAQLDYREKDGYSLHRVQVWGDEHSWECWTYVARPENPSYIGDRPLPELADRIRQAAGESGVNVDYIVRLRQRLRELAIHDPHVESLGHLLEN